MLGDPSCVGMKRSRNMNRRIAPWILAAGLVTGICFMIGIISQQIFRLNANDPQIQIAEDFARASVQNQFTDETLRSSFEMFTPAKLQVNTEISLSPWIQIYSETGEVFLSSAVLSDGVSVPHIPRGIFKEVDKHGELRVTWQPKKEVRQAIVVTKFTGLKNGYFVAGKSLAEVEKRISHLWWVIGILWGFIVIGIGLVAIWYFGYFPELKKIPRT